MPKKATPRNKLQFIPDCPISKLTPYKRNPRLNDQAVKAVSESIGRFGAVAPIIVDKDFNIAAGHTRYKAALERGKKTFPVLVVPHLTGDEFKAYNIADNQTATIAEWDMPELAAIIKELEAVEFPVDVLGFDDKELQDIMDSAGGNGDLNIGSLSIRVTQQFTGGRKLGKCHQNVLIFYNGDPKRIPKLDYPDDIWQNLIDINGDEPECTGQTLADLKAKRIRK